MDNLILEDDSILNLEHVVTAAVGYWPDPPDNPLLKVQLTGIESPKYYKGKDARRIWIGVGMGEWDEERKHFTTPFDEEE